MPTVNFSSIPDELPSYPWPIMLNQGYHWMDKYGMGHWIQDMSTGYLKNALHFAELACRQLSSAWWSFAFALNGEMAIAAAERYAMRYGEYDVPLVKGLEKELGIREGDERLDIGEWELEGHYDFLEWQGYEAMAIRGMFTSRTIRV